MPTQFERSFVTNGEVARYMVDGISVGEMARAAIGFVNVRAEDHAEFEGFREAQDRASRFADFCISETVDETGEWCDPTRSFRDFWERFVTSDHA